MAPIISWNEIEPCYIVISGKNCTLGENFSSILGVFETQMEALSFRSEHCSMFDIPFDDIDVYTSWLKKRSDS
jgi:hypothetical protein